MYNSEKEVSVSNVNKVFRAIYESKEISKREISDKLNLSLPTVTLALKELFASNLIYNNGFYESTGGRKAQSISIQSLSKVAVGVELLKESIKLSAINLEGKPIREEFILIPFVNSDEYYAHFGAIVNKFIDSLNIPDDSFLGVLIATQGLVSPDGSYISDGRILGTTGTKIDCFQKHIKLKCKLIHDTEASAFAELWQHPEIENAVYLVLNRNFGGALIINGKVYRGPAFGSCILEHMRLVPDGKLCYCGQRGCLEEYCSVNSLEDAAGMDVDTFFHLLSDGNDFAEKVFDNYLRYLAQAISNIRTLIDCNYIIGGFLEPYLTDAHIQKLYDLVQSNFAFNFFPFSFKRGYHGSNAASRGAALILINEFINSI